MHFYEQSHFRNLRACLFNICIMKLGNLLIENLVQASRCLLILSCDTQTGSSRPWGNVAPKQGLNSKLLVQMLHFSIKLLSASESMSWFWTYYKCKTEWGKQTRLKIYLSSVKRLLKLTCSSVRFSFSDLKVRSKSAIILWTYCWH